MLLPYLSLREANCVRITCRELRAAVADAPWVDERTRVFQPKPFFAAFPHARAANLSGQRAVDHHGKQRGVMERAESLRVCDGDLALAMACHTLDLADQAGITDAGFASLRAVRKLTLGWRSPYDWRQWRVMQPELKLTDAGLRSIGSTLRELTLYRTTSISGAGFDCLGQLEALELHDASRVPPAAFGSLYSLTTLKLFGASFPDEPLRALSAAAPGKLRKLDLHLVHDRFPSDAALRTCTGLTSLSTNHASAAGLAHLSGILRELTMKVCDLFLVAARTGIL